METPNLEEKVFDVPSRFRWRLESNSLLEFKNYVVDVEYDYYTKTLKATVLDAMVKNKPVVHNWIMKVLLDSSNEELKLTLFSSNGDTLYTKLLKNIKLIGHKCNYNYECEGDDLMDHELIFTYKTLETT